jgi:hypothetical protein
VSSRWAEIESAGTASFTGDGFRPPLPAEQHETRAHRRRDQRLEELGCTRAASMAACAPSNKCPKNPWSIPPRRGDVVLDTFSGSGTTIMAAERVGRHARALEIEPRFVDVAIRRWQAFTRCDACHAETGLSFDEIAAEASPAGRSGARTGGAKP